MLFSSIKTSIRAIRKDGIKYFESHKEAMLSKYSHLDTTGFNGLSIENAPTFEAFSSLITPFLPEDVKPLILLKRTNRQGIHTDICEYLISESQNKAQYAPYFTFERTNIR